MMKIATKFRNAAAALAVAMILGAPGTSAFADDKPVDVGKSEYDGACASGSEGVKLSLIHI